MPTKQVQQQEEQVQGRLEALQSLLVRGLLWGLAAAVASGFLGYLLAAKDRSGVLTGLNWGGTLLWMIGGAFISSSTKLKLKEDDIRTQLGQDATHSALPWAQTLVAFVAGTVCFLVWWLLH